MLLREFIPRCARSFPLDIAYIHGEQQRCWAEVQQRTEALAGALQSLGLRKGDPVAVLSGNRIELAEHWLACLKTGMVRVGVNPRYALREMQHALRDSGAKALIAAAGCLEPLRPAIEELERQGLVLIGFDRHHGLPHDYEQLIARGLPATLPALAPGDLALIGYTSGSTGLPKGVMLTQNNVMVSTLYQAFGPGFTRDDVRLYCANTAGINIFTACSNIVNGMKIVFDDFEVHRVLELIARHRVTRTTLVPTMLRRVVDLVRGGGHDVSSLRQVIYGSMPSTPALIREAYEVLGCELVQIYGASESSGPMTLLSNADHRRAIAGEPQLLRSAGRAYPHTEISIRDALGNPVPAGELGTVWIGGEVVMAGYLNRLEETREALPEPGWLRTGDIGQIDAQGYVFLSDRHKNMIISGGMNIHPPGIENALAEHPSVREAVVVGLPHPEWGEAVVAAVTLAHGRRASAEELVAHCKGLVAAWEVPKHIEILEALPEGFTEKIDKRAIKELLGRSPGLGWQH